MLIYDRNMKVYIFHYHLNPGGVTRIIESQIQALKKGNKKFDITLVTGHCENRSWYEKNDITVIEDEIFNYLTGTDKLQEKFRKVYRKLREICSTDGILHVHNLNLGKNPLVTIAISGMALEGYKILNHAHDFAEDRPDNMNFYETVLSKVSDRPLHDILYPDVTNYHFATLNGFDIERLRKTGIPESRLTLLPNPVVFEESTIDMYLGDMRNEVISILGLNNSKMIITYPVRVIRRKNISEFILLAGLFSDKANWVVTQPPKNPVEKKYYDKWKDFCFKENIKIGWEAGNKIDFEKLIKSSDFCITTSVQEGFGMVYMEPWLLNTPVIGRNIKMVTDDLKLAGMEFPMLYDRFVVEDNKELHELNFKAQTRVIKEYINDSSKKGHLLDQNTFLKRLFDLPSEVLIKRNKEVILKQFSLDNYSSRLNEIYQKLT